MTMGVWLAMLGFAVPNSAMVFRYDHAFGISRRALVRAVSDHYAVFAEFSIAGPDDDGPRRK